MSIHLLTTLVDTGAMSSVPVTGLVSTTWLGLHEKLPDDLTTWTEEQLLATEEDPEYHLLLLGHHKSVFALERIKARFEAGFDDENTESLAELAFAEALGWLGFNYHRLPGDAEPVITPVYDETQVARC